MQEVAWLKLIAKQSPVLVSLTDITVCEEHVINASILRKDQQAAGC